MDENNEIRCEVRLSEEVDKPTRLTGTLMAYGERAKDRAEQFEQGALSWPEGGVVLNRQHRRSAPILRFTPIESEGRVSIDAPIPDTTAGRDALAELSGPHPLFKGLSVEFRAIKETFVNGTRLISSAVLTGAGLVDSGSYAGATVEARAEAARREDDRVREFML